jgi:hypothetical protein
MVVDDAEASLLSLLKRGRGHDDDVDGGLVSTQLQLSFFLLPEGRKRPLTLCSAWPSC